MCREILLVSSWHVVPMPPSESHRPGGQTRADFFKSLHESAKSASGKLFADFFQTFFMKCTLCADFLQTFSVDQLLSCTLFADFWHTFCSK